MKLLPKVTVMVPSYNHGKFLCQRLESIFNQTYKNIELIVIDDCSDDDSDSIIRSYQGKHSFRHILSGRNSGSPFTAWERVVSIATGKYIWICESDDYADPSFLEIAVSNLEERPKAVLFYCDSWVVDDDGKQVGHTDSFFHDIWCETRWDRDFTNDGIAEMANFQVFGQTVPNMSSALISLTAFRSAYSSFLKKMKLTGDWLFIGLVMRYGDIIYCKKTLNYFRSHENTARVRVNSARSQAEFILTKYLLFRKAKKPVRMFANVVKTDAVRFIYEPASALDIIKALFHISIFKTVCCGIVLAVSLLFNCYFLNKFYCRHKTARNGLINNT